MVTGDNILTAVSVARNCGLVPTGDKLIRVVATVVDDIPSLSYHLLSDSPVAGEGKEDRTVQVENYYQFALDGATFDVMVTHYRASLLPFVVRRGAVFARMRPDMKQQLVEILQDLGYFVAMCGDGANDCGALKAAHSGISLSEAEASVASPFTSQTPDISCVPYLVQEGRAALVTSFGIFKYMAGYSITQFVSVMIHYDFSASLSDFQFLFVDLFIITTLAALFGLNRAYDGPLANRPPENSLISLQPLFSLFSQMAIVISFQVGALYLTQAQPWFVPFNPDEPCYNGTTAEEAFNASGLINLGKCTPEDNAVASYENYSVFCISQFQYIILAVAFAKGTPYRKNIFYNIPMMIDIIVLTAFCLYITIDPHQVFITGFIIGFEFFLPPVEYFNYRLVLVGLAVANLFSCLLFEALIADLLLNKLLKRRNQTYDLLEEELVTKPDWPPVTEPSSELPQSVQTKEATVNTVVVTGHGVAEPAVAFDSLFAAGLDNSTPTAAAAVSHTAAAYYLNPPPYYPRTGTGGGSSVSVPSEELKETNPADENGSLKNSIHRVGDTSNSAKLGPNPGENKALEQEQINKAENPKLPRSEFILDENDVSIKTRSFR